MLFYTKYTHPTLICRGTHERTDGRTYTQTENIYSIFRDKLLLLGEHVYGGSCAKSYDYFLKVQNIAGSDSFWRCPDYNGKGTNDGAVG